MSLISLNQVGLSFGERDILKNINIELYPYERIGLIGHNGSGKTSLVKMITGDLEPTKGHIQMPEYLSIGYLKQVNEQDIEDGSSYEVLSKIGVSDFKEVDDQRWQNLSGGEKTKFQLSSIFEQHYDLLILDEPTNHLDQKGRKWLMDQLEAYPGGYVIISHDRYFLNEVVDQIIEIEHQEVHRYTGNYDAFEAQKAHNR